MKKRKRNRNREEGKIERERERERVVFVCVLRGNRNSEKGEKLAESEGKLARVCACCDVVGY